MKCRCLTLTLVLVVTLLASGLVPAAAATPQAESLIQIGLRDAQDLADVEASGAPVYARLTGGDGGDYLLAGAAPDQVTALRSQDLQVTVLDADRRGASYYLAYLMPGRERVDWGEYGRLLLDDGAQVLLRATPADAERLPLAGIEIARVTLDPKPLRPAAAAGAFPEVITPDPLIQSMMDQVNQTNVYNYTGDLSGEWPVSIGGAPYTIATRHTYSGTSIQKATQFVGEHLAGLGLDVEYHQWSGATYPNVIGELPGLIDPDQIFIIGAHLDDMPSGGLAPGADDNASGSVATLLAADILTQYQWGCTLRFAFWTGEEQGLLGSAAYAQRAYNSGENIAGYLNLDMVAWNTASTSPDIDLHAKSSLPQTLVLAQLFADVVDAYNLNLIPEIKPNGTGASDHASFWNYGYTSILGIEDMSDFNPFYHTVNDDMDNFQDWPYYVEFVKASIGAFAHMGGCLIPSGIGALDGHVTAASGGAPLANATVTMTNQDGNTLQTTTNSSGYYTRTLLSGTYTVTAEAYSYLPALVGGVVITTDTVTTRDFALQTAPTFLVSGTVSEQGSGDPLFAQVQVQGSPVTVWTDPATGFYQATLPQGAYTLRVSAYSHRSQERPIVVDQNQIQDFALEPLPCILLVDDDAGDNYESWYEGALADAGQDYEPWSVASSGSPTAADLAPYGLVIWLTGDDYGSTLTSGDQTALATYLDAGGRLFVSGQDIGYDIHTDPFYANYLHAVYNSDDTNNYTLTGLDYLAGLNLTIQGGDGANNQQYPSDITPIGGAVAVLDYPSPYLDGGVAYQDATYGVVYFSFGFEAINNQADRTEVMSRTLAWLGNCQSPDGWLVGQVTDAASGAPLAGAEVLVQPAARGSIQAITDPSGHYTMTLPADTYDVTASKTGYVSQTATGVEVQVGMTTTQDFSLEPVPGIVVEPPALEAALYADQVETQTLWITNTGAASLDFWLHEMSRTLALDADPRSRPRTEPVVDAALWDQVRAEGQAQAIIYLRELADLRPAYAMDDWAARGRFVYKQLQQTAERSGGELRALLAATGAEPRSLLATNAIAATVDAQLLERVAARPEVAHVGPDAVLSILPLTPGEQEAASETVAWNIAKIRADEAWNTFGSSGQGVTVGNVGTGVMYTHAALVAQYRGNLGGGTLDHNHNWFDFVNGQPTPYDDNGHSTFTTGVMVGDDGAGNQIGVAPGARWIAAKAISGSGSATESWLHMAMAWMLAPTDLGGNNPDPAKRPQVGLGTWPWGAGCNTEFQPDLAAWRAADILPVFAGGGEGPACGTIRTPAALPDAVTAGATDASDTIAPFSPRGPSPCGSVLKPEVAAPGVNVRSSYNDGTYTVWSGSASSAAHLAGAAALVLAADPSLGASGATAILTETALCIEDLSCGGTPCPDGANNVYGWGRLDAFEAVSLVLGGPEYDLPWLSETPTSGALDPGAGLAIAVTFDAGGLQPGVYLGLLDVESNDPATPHVGVPVTLTVLPPCEPVAIVTVTTAISDCAVTFGADLAGTAPFSYTWDLGAFGSFSAPTPTVDFGASGSYPYTLTVSNCGGAFTATFTGTVMVACQPVCEPVEVLTVTHEVAGCAVTFGADLAGTAPFSYTWDYGLGVSFAPTPTVAFGASGVFPYTLTVVNCAGAFSDTVTGTVSVACETPRWYVYLPVIVRPGP